jgi:hypothetical protein
MAKRSSPRGTKRPARILGIRPWLLIVGSLGVAGMHAIAKAKHRRRLATVDRADERGGASASAERTPARNDTPEDER